ncbi:MAG: MazG nucleotide pyrophosphohydrolase domain-containing protein [Candidatus Omnitrophota bacterium]|jgi:tetrapyrrole methylase family protein/MazG family protein
MKKKKTVFIELKEVFQTLHGPRGCLWDKKQTFSTLIPHFKEEAQELVSAVRGKNNEHIKEELGDVLLHVMAYSQIAEKSGVFDIEDVIAGLISKLKRRHPHVFGGEKVSSTRQIIKNWNKIKKLEKGE